MFVKIKDDVYCQVRLPWNKRVQFSIIDNKISVKVFNKISKSNYLEWTAPLILVDKDYQKSFERTESELYSSFNRVTSCKHVFTDVDKHLECMGSGRCSKCNLVLDHYFMNDKVYSAMKLAEFYHNEHLNVDFDDIKKIYHLIHSCFKQTEQNESLIKLYCASFLVKIREYCPDSEIVAATSEEVLDIISFLPHDDNISVIAKVLRIAEEICFLKSTVKDPRFHKDVAYTLQCHQSARWLYDKFINELKKQKQDPFYVEFRDKVVELLDDLDFISQKVKHLAECKKNFFIEIPNAS